MFTTQARRFDDPQDYVATIRGTAIDVVDVRPGDFKASLRIVNLGRVRLQRGRESLGWLARNTSPTDRVGFNLPKTTSAPIIRNTTAVTAKDLLYLGLGQTSSWHSTGPSDWATMSLSVKDFDAAHRTLLGVDPAWKTAARFLRPDLVLAERLQRCHQAAIDAAEQNPSVFDDPEAIRGFEQALVETLVQAIASGQELKDASCHHHARILARFGELMMESPDAALYITDVCDAIGVSRRTLRLVFARYLGMSPLRYLYLWRMRRARNALLQASFGTTTVTTIAMSFGFWELGRFAVGYRALFGETPLATLRAPPVHGPEKYDDLQMPFASLA